MGWDGIGERPATTCTSITTISGLTRPAIEKRTERGEIIRGLASIPAPFSRGTIEFAASFSAFLRAKQELLEKPRLLTPLISRPLPLLPSTSVMVVLCCTVTL